jgi:hypothetical protein
MQLDIDVSFFETLGSGLAKPPSNTGTGARTAAAPTTRPAASTTTAAADADKVKALENQMRLHNQQLIDAKLAARLQARLDREKRTETEGVFVFGCPLSLSLSVHRRGCGADEEMVCTM